MINDFLFTSESVTEGHPDKICDQISDAVVDECLSLDSQAKVACEVLITDKKVIIAGEISLDINKIDFERIVKEVIKKIGYDDVEKGLDYKNVDIVVLVNKQSEDIAMGVEENRGLYEEQGAGDQGLMFGYATDESESYMPFPIYCAHLLAKQLAHYRRENILKYLRPDGKTQVTVEYCNDRPHRIHTVVVSAQHDPDITHEQITKDLIQMVNDTLPGNFIDQETIFLINPTGRFVQGGPQSDCGLTGRKLIVDTYGAMGRHGGGAFSGKDPSKVDRSAAYAARYIAKNIVAADIASECEVQLAYAIGYSKPVSINVNTFNTSNISESKLAQAIGKKLPLTPKWIIDKFDLMRPIYSETATYGHFGRDPETFHWEKLDLVDFFKQLAEND